MKFTTGSKRADIVREFFYWVTFMLVCGKLNDTTYGLLVGALITTYLGNRAVESWKGAHNAEPK